jgi:hypothetical protein
MEARGGAILVNKNIFMNSKRNIKTNLLKWFKKIPLVHKIFHNINPLFYTLSPDLLVAIVKAFNYQKINCGPLIGHGFYEFGLYKGFSFWFAERVSLDYTGSDFHLYGFDSFQGLPESDVDKTDRFWSKGTYTASYEYVLGKLEKYGSDRNRFSLYKGYFSQKLWDKLNKTEKFLPVSICVIDADIYESCVEVLRFISAYLVVGSILIFDDFNVFEKDESHGERKALKEFLQRNPSIKLEHLFDFGELGAAFKVVNIFQKEGAMK